MFVSPCKAIGINPKQLKKQTEKECLDEGASGTEKAKSTQMEELLKAPKKRKRKDDQPEKLKKPRLSILELIRSAEKEETTAAFINEPIVQDALPVSTRDAADFMRSLPVTNGIIDLTDDDPVGLQRVLQRVSKSCAS